MALRPLADDAEDGAEDGDAEDDAEDGANKQSRHFAVGLQGRLWSKVHKTAAMTPRNTTAALWSKTVPHSS